MSLLPTLDTERLRLRPFQPADAESLSHLAGDRHVSAMSSCLPHPFSPADAQAWIAGQIAQRNTSHEGAPPHSASSPATRQVWLAVTDKADGELIGAVGFELAAEHGRGELLYWIGEPFWGHGYATEAAAELVRFAFQTLKLHRVQACVMSHNTPAARVIAKLGLCYEGTFRGHQRKWGVFFDVEQYALLRTEFSDSHQVALPGHSPRELPE